MDAANWISLGSLIVAVGAVVLSIRSDRRASIASAAADQARERSADALQQAADALSRSSDADTRSAEALAAVRDELARMRPADRVRWSLEHFDRDRYAITNTGTLEAINVVVVLGDDQAVFGEEPAWPSIRPGETKTFMASQAGMGGRSAPETEIRWEDATGDDHTWSAPFPAKP